MCIKQIFQGNAIQGGEEITLPLDDGQKKFPLTLPLNCFANGLPLVTDPGTLPCSEAEPTPLLQFEFNVPAGTPQCTVCLFFSSFLYTFPPPLLSLSLSLSPLEIAGGADLDIASMYVCVCVRAPSFHPPASIFIGQGPSSTGPPSAEDAPTPIVSLDEISPGISTDMCEAQTSEVLTLSDGESENGIVVSIVQDSVIDECIINNDTKPDCRVFRYEVGQNVDGGPSGPSITTISFEMPSCITVDQFEDLVGAQVNSVSLPTSALSAEDRLKIQGDMEMDIVVLTIDLGGVVQAGENFTVSLVYGVSFVEPAASPFTQIVNPFDSVVLVSAGFAEEVGLTCGANFCELQSPPPPLPSPSPPPMLPIPSPVLEVLSDRKSRCVHYMLSLRLSPTFD